MLARVNERPETAGFRQTLLYATWASGQKRTTRLPVLDRSISLLFRARRYPKADTQVQLRGSVFSPAFRRALARCNSPRSVTTPAGPPRLLSHRALTSQARRWPRTDRTQR